MDPCHVQVGEKGGVGFVEVVIAFEQRGSRRCHHGLKERGRTDRAVEGGEDKMLENRFENTHLAEVTRKAFGSLSRRYKLTCQTKGKTFRFVRINKRAMMRETLPGPVNIPMSIARIP